MLATIPLQAVSVLAEAFAANFTPWAVHRVSPCFLAHHDFIIQQALAVCQGLKYVERPLISYRPRGARFPFNVF